MGSPHEELKYTLSSRGKRDGPFTEAELILLGREGRIRAGDRIRAAGEKSWTRASRIPWITDRDGQPLKESGTPPWIQVVALVLVLAGLVGVLTVRRDAERDVEVIDFGVVQAPTPDPTQAIFTEAWGAVPPGRLNVRFHSGASRTDATRVAAAIGGSIVGELPLLDLYVIDFPSTSERGLQAALARAQSENGVRSAFPEQVAFLAGVGRACSLTDDPVYADGRDRSLDMIGVQTAWNLLRASGARLHPVQIGIVDGALFVENGELDGGVRIVAPGAADRLTEPERASSGEELPYASHATGIANVIAADADDGGIVGVASILGELLTLRVRNAFHAGFPTQSAVEGDTPGAYAIGTLAVMQSQIERGARVINLSWCVGIDPGTGAFRRAHVGTYRAYRDFFRRISRRHPKVVFVCSAGNTRGTPTDEGFLPGGLDLPNVVTVANLDGAGRARTTGTTSMSADHAFHVDLAAPGQGVVYGVGSDGAIAAGDGGTSHAAALVTATVAILKALDPSLTCTDIRAILRSSARAEIVRVDGSRHAVPEDVGQGCLAVDLAVLEVLNRRRAARGKPEKLELEALLALTHIDLEAVRQEGADEERWTVTASVPRTSRSTTRLTIRGAGGAELAVAEGLSETVTAGQTVSWTVTPTEERPVEVEVVRADTDACWRVELSD